ncbi:MAG: hypothetical protein ICCCNLDF_01509 [Planctomycetes bacterium]|nr:hypothetical protein [Planctomycetota bacterium]
MVKQKTPVEAGAGTAGDATSPIVPTALPSVKTVADKLETLYGERWFPQLIRTSGPEWGGQSPGKRALDEGWQALPRKRRSSRAGPRQVAFELGQHLARGGNVGLVLPENVCVLDHDSPASFQAALTMFPDAPAQQSHNGGHTVHRLPKGAQLVNRTGVELDDGSRFDIRADGTYIVCEPSLHPGGTPYKWLRPLPQRMKQIPVLPPGVLNQLPKRYNPAADTGTQRHNHSDNPCPAPIALSSKDAPQGEIACVTESLRNCVSAPELSPDEQAAVEAAIMATLPSRNGQRHRCVYRLACRLKAIEVLASLQADALKHIVKRWHAQAYPNISTKPFGETWLDFRVAWGRAKAHGANWQACVDRARRIPDPLASLISGILCDRTSPPFELMIAIACELDAFHKGKPFPFPCRKVGEATGLDRDTANKRIQLLTDERVLFLVKEASQIPGGFRAAEYKLNRNWPREPGPSSSED